jgi:hypothetical protein
MFRGMPHPALLAISGISSGGTAALLGEPMTTDWTAAASEYRTRQNNTPDVRITRVLHPYDESAEQVAVRVKVVEASLLLEKEERRLFLLSFVCYDSAMCPRRRRSISTATRRLNSVEGRVDAALSECAHAGGIPGAANGERLELIDHGILSEADRAALDRHFFDTNRKRINVVPRLALEDVWPLMEAEKADPTDKFQEEVRARIEQVLAAWGQEGALGMGTG